MAFLDRKIRTCLQRENAQIWLTATIFKNTANNTHNIFYSQIERTTFIASIRAIARDTKSQLILNIDVQITKYSTNNCDFSHFKCEHNKKKTKIDKTHFFKLVMGERESARNRGPANLLK